MRIKNIHQFSAGFNPGDAISNEMLSIKKIIKQELGIDGNIYSENIGFSNNNLCKKFNTYKYKSSDILIYHHSIHSSVLKHIKDMPIPKIMIYHNVTPHHFFEPFDLKLTYYLKKGREELQYIQSNFDVYLADSEYNRSELIHFGYNNVKVLPILYDFSKLSKKEPKKTSKKQIIFIGRIAPNKKQEDLIRFAKVFHEVYSKNFELHIIGHCSLELWLYKEELIHLVKDLNLEDTVYFSDFVNDQKINEYYQNADLFLSMSEHEGFCVPLLESMFHQVPIIAYNAGAVKDTLSGSGILFYKKDMLVLCELAYRAIHDSSFRKSILTKQNQTLETFINTKHYEILIHEIKQLQ